MLSLLLLISSLSAMDNTGLQVSLAADLVYFQGLNDTSKAPDKLSARSAEMMFYAPVDHRFEGTLSGAAHEEGGENVFELHELFLSSGKLIPRSRLKVGRFFLGVGRLNQIHQHDWPFISAPKVQRQFFAEEGVFDTGLEMSHLLPLDFYLEATWGLTSGHRFGHSHSAGAKPKTPTHYVRLASFLPLAGGGLLGALNTLGRTDIRKRKMRVSGLELIFKRRRGKTLSFLLQTESWHRRLDKSEQVGLYVFGEKGLDRAFSLGLRLDTFKDLAKRHAISGKKINNIEYTVSPQLSWRSSEFAKLRAGLSHGFVREEGQTHSRDTRLELQAVFILGTHPAHEF